MGISSISTNIAAISAVTSINRASFEASNSIARLSSGNQQIRPADDPASLAVGSKLASQLAGMRSALTNSNQGTSMMQVASGGITEIIDILERQKALAVQAQSGSLTSTERGFLNQEFQELTKEIDQIADTTDFNNVNLLNGGLGTQNSLFTTDALAAAFDPSGADINTGVSAASTVAIQAFNTTNGTLMNGTTTAGHLDIVDSSNTLLSDAAYSNVHGAVYGQFESFEITDVSYGVSATLTATLNGIEFSGSFSHNATAVTISNGSTYIRLGTSALDITNDATTSVAQAQLVSDFSNTTILRTGIIKGVDFNGTRLEDAVGTSTRPLASLRIASASSNITIGNFKYVGNSGANANILSVEINGTTFTASGVSDTIDDTVATILAFDNGNGEALVLDITGLTSGSNTAISNIRTNSTDREAFISALNVGFSRAGGGISFNISGTDSSDTINVALDSAASSNLYDGQSYDITTTSTAATAETGIEAALDKALEIQADIGAIQARFDHASASVESAILGVDAARSNLLDTDIAYESTIYASKQVQLQAGVAALAQANLLPAKIIEVLDFG